MCWAVRTAPTSCHHTAQLAFLWAQIREVLRRHCVERGESTQQRCRVWKRLQHLPGHVVVGTMRGLAGWLVCRQEAPRRGWRGIWRKTEHEHERHDGPRKQQPPDRRHGELAQGRAGSSKRAMRASGACRRLQGGNAAHSRCACATTCAFSPRSLNGTSFAWARGGAKAATRRLGDSLGIKRRNSTG